MRIYEFDCPRKEKITKITPNSFSFGDKYYKKKGKWYLQRTTDFRTNNRFALRLYYAFLPLWKLCHFFDINFANKIYPNWNLGFDTLTKYPYPADGTNNTVDGRVFGSNATWSTIRGASAGSTAEPSITSGVVVQAETTGGLYNLSRCFFLFDTSALNIENLVIDNATFYVYPTGAGSNLEATNPADLTLVGSTPASNTTLGAGDFDQLGTVKLSDTVFDLGTFIAAGAYCGLGLNATGLAAIVTTGITKLGIRANNDYDNVHAPTARSYGSGVYADGGGTTTGPKLVVTYSIVVPNTGAFFNFF